MKKELNLFFVALMYYSRIPVPKNLECSEQTLSKAFRYFPLIGIIVAGIGAGCFVLSNKVMPQSVCILFTLAVMIMLTGCLHEDGFADFFDGFGGGNSKDAILRIMKDSHIGTYGVVALVLLLAFKFTAMQAISIAKIPSVLIAAHAISRVFPILLIKSSVYARDGQSKAQHTRSGVDRLSLVVAIIFGAVPLLFFNFGFVICYLLLAAVLFVVYKCYLHKKIGGFTGDTLGALQQFTELLFYITYLSTSQLWTESFI